VNEHHGCPTCEERAMPYFEVIHEVKITITHRIEAITAREANSIAVELSLARMEALQHLHKAAVPRGCRDETKFISNGPRCA
jgi:hypothetical protein